MKKSTDKDEISASLKGIELLADLSAKEVEAIEHACRFKTYRAHEQIIDRQSGSQDVFFVVHGKVRVVNYSLAGREITLDDVGAGSYFGELSAIDGQPRSASVMALAETLVASLPRTAFLKVLGDHPSTAHKLMTRLAQIVRSATDRIMDLSTLAANNRVHAELLRLARAGMKGENKAVIRPIPVHGDIASRISTTRETVARVLNDLARQGVVTRTKDSLLVNDVERLGDLVEEVRGD